MKPPELSCQLDDLTIELANELWVAREKLSRETVRWDKSSTYPSWAQYCRDIGSSKRVVNRWFQMKQKFCLPLPVRLREKLTEVGHSVKEMGC